MNHNNIAYLYDEYQKEGYGQIARDQISYPLYTAVPELIKNKNLPLEGFDVLDIGCGPGLLPDFTKFKEYVGVDVSESMLKEAVKNGYKSVIQSSIQDALEMFEDNSFDAVFCISVLYFLSPKDAKWAIEQMRRITKNYVALTLDGIPQDLIELYMQENSITMYNHRDMKIKEIFTKQTIEGWESPLGGRIPIDIVILK